MFMRTFLSRTVRDANALQGHHLAGRYSFPRSGKSPSQDHARPGSGLEFMDSGDYSGTAGAAGNVRGAGPHPALFAGALGNKRPAAPALTGVGDATTRRYGVTQAAAAV